jgi:hypothetical protein
MATYTEIYDFVRGNAVESLTKKVTVALAVKAVSFLAGTPTAPQKEWAAYCLRNPETYVVPCLRAMVAFNKALTIAQLTAAPEGDVQTNVDAVVDKVFIAA